MSQVDDVNEAEDMVYQYYRERFPLGPGPTFIETHKQGYTWIVRYRLQSVVDYNEYEAHINANTGKMLRIK